MKKVGVCGFFSYAKEDHGGQPVKTRQLYSALNKILGIKSTLFVDTYNWKKRPVLLMIRIIILIGRCENVIMLPAKNGLKVFSPIFVFLNNFFRRKIHYVVIGGWLPDLLLENAKLLKKLEKFEGIYVETQTMVEKLQDIGLKNVVYLPNFKELDILEEDLLLYHVEGPYSLCTFSRVSKEKGIEDAIKAVIEINNKIGIQAFKLDIYGQIDKSYENTFETIKQNFPNYISYKGVVDSNSSVNVLKNYFALLFPTYYEGEGFAGTILDAYASGLPIITTNWRYNQEIICDGNDGYIYNYDKKDELNEILFRIYKNPNEINEMKKNCLKRAEEYLPETVINHFINYLE